MFAAMRLGYIVVPPALVDPFVKARNLLGQSSSAVIESAMAQFMVDGRSVEHIRKMRRVYRDRRDVLFECLRAECSAVLDVQHTDAGMHMLGWLKHGIDDRTAHETLLNAGIESLPLSVYASSPLTHDALVLGFTGTHEKHIPKLVKRLGAVLQTLM